MNSNNESIVFEKLPCKDFMDKETIIVLNRAELCEISFYRKDLNRLEIQDAVLDRCDFKGVACDASKFQNVSFISCDFSGATFQDSSFVNCRFINCISEATNFSRSVFFDSEIIESKITLSTLHQCLFESCCIVGGDFHTSTFNGTKIINTKVKELDLSHLNIEFVMISGLLLEGNVVLPPYQIAYMLNGMSYAIDNTDKFQVYTDKGIMPGEYYIEQLSLLQNYYESKKEFFPLANILLARKQIKDAISIIDEGIHDSIDTKDYRMLKNYCWLLKETSEVSIGEKHEIYRKINTYVNSIPLTQIDYFSYTTYMGEIRELMLNSISGQPRLEISIYTVFSQNNVQNIYELISTITEVVNNTKTNRHVDFIEVRHNSPYEIVLSCIDNAPELLLVVSTLYFSISKGIPKLLEVAKQSLELVKTAKEIRFDSAYKKHEMEEWSIETERKKQEVEKIKLENMKLSNEIKLSESTIAGINGIRHTISASSISDTKDIPSSVLMGDYKKTD